MPPMFARSTHFAAQCFLFAIATNVLVAGGRAQNCEEEWERPLDQVPPTMHATRMGEAVDIDGDWAVVGAPKSDQLENPPLVNQIGVAFVFERDVSSGEVPGTRWTRRRTLQIAPPHSPQFNDFFGQSVAISGNRVIAGAPNDDFGMMSNAGSAFIWVRNGTAWSQEQRIQVPIIPGAAANDQFGWSVDIDNPSGWAIVGAIETGFGSGSVYAYRFTQGAWSAGAELVPAISPISAAAFGDSVSIDGSTAVVGGPLHDISGSGPVDAGGAWVFERSGTTWSQQGPILTANTPLASDQFGCAVGIDQDTIAIGACGEDTVATDAGAVYVFTRAGTTWSLQQRLLPTVSITAGERFGRTVSISGDTIIAGSASGDRARVFLRSGPAWTEQQPVLVSGNGIPPGSSPPPTEFGCSVAVDGTLAVVGAPLDDTADIGGWADSGGAHFFTSFDDTVSFYGTPEPTGSTGCNGSALSVSGTATLSPGTGSFFIQANDATCSDLGANHAYSGALIWGISGEVNMGLGDGTILVKNYFRVITLFGIEPGPCSAQPLCGRSIKYDFNQEIQSGNYPADLFPGRLVNAQWILDHANEGSSGSGEPNNKETTDAVRFVVCP